MVLNFCVPVCFFFPPVVFAQIQSFTQCHTTTQTCFLIIYLLSKLYIFSWLHASFLHLVEHEPFSDFWVHSVEGQLDPSLAVLSTLLMLRTKIHCPRHHSYLLSVLYLSFSEYRQLWSPGGIVIALLILSCGIFLKKCGTVSAAICGKNNVKPLVHFTGFLHHGQQGTIWCSLSTHHTNLLQPVTSGIMLHLFCFHFLYPNSLVCRTKISFTSYLSHHPCSGTWPLSE